jgi:outer membrane protein assembly factor BamB
MILVDGCVYALTDKGVLYCWLASDGTELWRERLEGPVSASPIYAAGHIYWANEDGTYYVFKPNREKFELVATNRLGSEAFASPAVSGSRLLLRSAEGKGTARQETLYCLTVE